MTTGSSLWQMIFVSFALVLILFEVVRGWQRGAVRQVVRLFALAAAYTVAFFGGRMLLPLVRPFLRAPDFFISIVAGAILALVVYAGIATLGAILFKRTDQQGTGIVRLLYGVCGAALGVFFGLFGVWLVVVAIRSAGAIANGDLGTHSIVQHQSAPLTTHPQPSPSAPAITVSIAKLKNSIELGSLGEIVRAVDVVPAQAYQTLGKVGTVVSRPESAGRFLSYPGAKELAENAKIVALRDDPEIIELIRQGRFLDVLQNPKLIEAMNDPALAAQLRRFDFQKALDYALKK
jgi:uncharacterized membrane protein required for colicin V production